PAPEGGRPGDEAPGRPRERRAGVLAQWRGARVRVPGPERSAAVRQPAPGRQRPAVAGRRPRSSPRGHVVEGPGPADRPIGALTPARITGTAAILFEMRRSAAVACALVVLAVACGDGGGGGPSPSGSAATPSSASPSTSATPSAVASPAASPIIGLKIRLEQVGMFTEPIA